MCPPPIPAIAPLVQDPAAARALNIGLTRQVVAVVVGIVTQTPICCVHFFPSVERADLGAAVARLLVGVMYFISAMYLTRGLRYAGESVLHALGRMLAVVAAVLLVLAPAVALAMLIIAGQTLPAARALLGADAWLRTIHVVCIAALLGGAARVVGRDSLRSCAVVLLVLLPLTWIVSYHFGIGLLESGKLWSEPGILIGIPPAPNEVGIKGATLAYGLPAIVSLVYILFLFACRVPATTSPGQTFERGPTPP